MKLKPEKKSMSEPEPSASRPDDDSIDPVDAHRAHARDLGMSLLKYSTEGAERKKREIELNAEYLEEVKQKIENLRQELDKRKASLIRRIMDYRQIRTLRAELGRKESLATKSEDEQRNRRELVDFFEAIIKSETELGELMEQAHEENRQFDEKKRQEFIADEEGRSMPALVKKHQVFFVHDIVDADWKPSANNQAIDTQKLDFYDQLNIVLGLQPTIATSTLSPNSKNRTFGMGSWGVLLSGGRIKGGEEGDAATVGVSRNHRTIEPKLCTLEAIDAAIERPRGRGKIESETYNELVVERPEVAGLYFKWGDHMTKIEENKDVFIVNTDRIVYDKWWTSLEGVMQTGVPIFVIERNNNVRLVYDIDPKRRSVKFTPRYDPENLSDMPGIYKAHLTEYNRRAAAVAVIDKVRHTLTPEELAEYDKEREKKYDRRSFYNIY